MTISCAMRGRARARAVMFPLSYLFSNPRDNINWVYGFGEQQQAIIVAPLFVLFLMLMFPLVLYVPLHFLLDRIFGPSPSSALRTSDKQTAVCMQPASERSSQASGIVTVFGGTGFLGRRVVRHLLDGNFSVRVATRHSQRARQLFGANVEPVTADVHNERSVAKALLGAQGAVNAVSLYVEHSDATFQSVHVKAAHRIASIAHRNGVERLVHVSGIGADAASLSPYIRSRGEGELAVRSAFPNATFVRPAVMFGLDDAFLTVIIKLLRRLPVYPMFGRGHTRLQPAYVEDVAQAVANILQRSDMFGATLECAGPDIYAYRDLLKTIANLAYARTALVPVPFTLWHALARVVELLPQPPLTRNQVELMEIDSVASPDAPGFDQLGISPRSIEAILSLMIEPAA